MTRIEELLPTFTKEYLKSYISHRFRIEDNGCWRWTHAINQKGYGQIRIPTGNRNRLTIKAHRLVAYIYLDFNLDPNKQICHKCNNEYCVNPDHLYVGDNSSNQLDSIGTGKKSYYKTREYCTKGHKFTVDNTKYYKTQKLCKACINESARSRRLRRKINGST